MENKFYTDDFERLIKERSDEFRMYPSKRVWHSIYNDLHPGRRWPSIAMSLMLIIALLYMGFLNNDSAAPKQAAINGVDKKNSLIADNKGSTDHSSNNNFGSTPATTGIDNSNGTSTLSSSVVTTINTNVVTAPHRQADLSILTSANAGEDIAANTSAADQQAKSNRTAHRRIVTNRRGRSSITVTNTAASIDNDKTSIAKNSIKATAASTSSTQLEPTVDNNDATTDVATTGAQNNTGINTNTTTSTIANKESDNTKSKELQSIVSNDIKNVQLETEKAWIENYAFYNKSNRKRWKDRMAIEFHLAPSVSYRSLTGKASFDPAASSFASMPSADNVNSAVRQSPGLGLETGVGLVYSAAKKLRFTGGLQLNFTSYNIHADNTSHPVITTLLLNNAVTGMPDVVSASSTLSNVSNLQPTVVHSRTYQFSVPLGMAWKLYGNNKLEWYAGASIQPSYVFGGQTFLVSSDRKNYVQDNSFMRRWNLNTGVETYVNYNVGTFNLQFGPQFRYQLFSTFNKQYTNTEKLYNVGLKIGLVKNF